MWGATIAVRAASRATVKRQPRRPRNKHLPVRNGAAACTWAGPGLLREWNFTRLAELTRRTPIRAGAPPRARTGAEEHMDIETDTNLIAAELMAVQGILMCVLRRIAAVDQNLASAVEDGFDDAINLAEKMKVALGPGVSSKEAVESLRTIERLRAGILGNHDMT
jgi:hypothetical protein